MSDVEFCKNCLKLIDEVHRTRRSIIITRNGVPLVRVIPAGPKPGSQETGQETVVEDCEN
jgi:antitoxin (DNA-binding transcriptional repressor) of toxin-antitoxin stability system